MSVSLNELSMNVGRGKEMPPIGQAVQREFNNLLIGIRRRLMKTRDRAIREKTEREVAWITHEVRSYGFRFYADHYHADNIERLRSILDSLTPAKK